MDYELRPFKAFARCFVDDIVIFSDTKQDHLDHLRSLLSHFSSINLRLAPSKSFLGYSSVELLGHQVNGDGLSTSAHRVKAIRQLSFPKTLHQLENYIGITG